jgi:hypothetical protein
MVTVQLRSVSGFARPQLGQNYSMLIPSVMQSIILQPTNSFQPRQGIGDAASYDFVSGKTGDPQVELSTSIGNARGGGLRSHDVEQPLDRGQFVRIEVTSTKVDCRYLQHFTIDEELLDFLEVDRRYNPAPPFAAHESVCFQAK